MRTSRSSKFPFAGAIARLLSGSWRPTPPAASVAREELIGILPLLLQSGAGPIAWWVLRDSTIDLAAQPFEELRQSYRLTRLKTTAHRARAVRIFELLLSHGIESILIKGLAITSLYPDPALRPFGDIDLCVDPDDHARTKTLLDEAMRELGIVDLHRGCPDLAEVPWTVLLARSRMVAIGDCGIRVLSEEDQLRLLAIHFMKHAGYRPLWLCDIAAAIETRSERFDWDVFLAGPKKRTQWASTMIRLAHEVLGAELGDSPIRVDSPMPRWLVPALLREWENPYHWPGGRLPVGIWLLKHRESVLTELRRRWPAPLEATFNMGAPINDFPRLPFQCLQFAARIPAAVRQVVTLASARRERHPS